MPDTPPPGRSAWRAPLPHRYDEPGAPGRNTGHGRIHERPDGRRLRCGGPVTCRRCHDELADKVLAANRYRTPAARLIDRCRRLLAASVDAISVHEVLSVLAGNDADDTAEHHTAD